MPRFDIHSIARNLARHPRWVIRLVQLTIFGLAGVLAFQLRFDFVVPPQFRADLVAGICVWIVAKGVVFHFLKMDRGSWHYASVADLTRVVTANLAGSALGALALLSRNPWSFPRSIFFVDFLLCLGMTAGIRLAVRLMFEFSKSRDLGTMKRTLIYGAGSAGVTLLREIQQNPDLAYEVVGFIDDDPRKAHLLIYRIKVFGSGGILPSIIASHGIETVLIAMPSATGAQMTEVLKCCHEACVSYRTVPSLAEVIDANGLASQIRDVAVEDLLGRNPVHLDENRIRASLEGKIILVTGAAGSIGSELCRQIARFHPAGIVGFEIAESPLFEIDREMRKSFPETPFYPEIGSIQNRFRLDEVLRRYSPSIIYHAAAYKHVPLMETHVFEAIENNIFGTYNVARAAAQHQVKDFVMISSDKAVRSTNVMGATKRVSELLLLALENGRTKYVAVRFGNVLGSNGSVIPTFKKQIASGGPVTVTHPDMRRFFMTIPEACQLVLEAGLIGKGGQICVLDMGAPVKIVDLARNLILLSGLRPDHDIKIEFTGMRPGEKLYEELNTVIEETVPTAHEKIRIFVGSGKPAGDVEMWMNGLREACEKRDVGRLVVALKEIAPDYSPSAQLLKCAIDHRPSNTGTLNLHYALQQHSGVRPIDHEQLEPRIAV
jgi:FlaA1/EpsC-like NDP-sugar epimerase